MQFVACGKKNRGGRHIPQGVAYVNCEIFYERKALTRGSGNLHRMADLSAPLLAASQWRQLVNAITHTAIISTDEHGRVTSWNSGAQQVLGWTEVEMLGQDLSRPFPKNGLTQPKADSGPESRAASDQWRKACRVAHPTDRQSRRLITSHPWHQAGTTNRYS
jgi:PAS domain-containing protein